MSDNKTWTEKRNEVFATLSRGDRRILAAYEREHGRLQADAIYKVIADVKETTRETKEQRQKARARKRK